MDGLLHDLRSDLTIERKKIGDFGDNEAGQDFVHLYSETDEMFGLPRSYFFENVMVPHDYRWKFSLGHPIEVTNTLRHEGFYAEQAVAIDRFYGMFSDVRRRLEALSDGMALPSDVWWLRDAGGILQAKTAWGKTAWALGLAARLGVTTLIVVHKEFLMRQWVSRIRKFLPDAKVGIIQENRCEFEGRDFVVAMVHSLALDDTKGTRYPSGLYEYFGLILTDEVHRIAAASWADIPRRFSALFRVGISATPRRKDGTAGVFRQHIGDVKFVATSPAIPATVAVRRYNVRFGEKVTSGELKSSIVVSILAKDRTRNRFIAGSILDSLRHRSQRKILVISHRLEQLEQLELMISGHSLAPDDTTIGHYTGAWYSGKTKSVLKAGSWEMDSVGRAKAVLAIYQSIRRRKHPCQVHPYGTHGGVITGACADGLGDICHELCPGGKIHAAWLDPESVSVVFHKARPNGMWVALEMMSDDELFSLAAYYNIRQKSQRSMVKLTEADLYEAERARLILATYQMVEEGVDLPPVDTLIFATPNSDIEQTIGRGRRRCVPTAHGGVMELDDCKHFCPWRWDGCKSKPALMVMDPVDTGVNLAEKRYRYREQYYRFEGFRIV